MVNSWDGGDGGWTASLFVVAVEKKTVRLFLFVCLFVCPYEHINSKVKVIFTAVPFKTTTATTARKIKTNQN